MIITDLNQINVLDKKVGRIDYKSGAFSETNSIISKGYRYYMNITSKVIESKYLDCQTTDKVLLKFMVSELETLFDLTNITFYRKERKTRGKFNGYYGINIDIGFKIGIKTQLKIEKWEKQIDDVISKCRSKFNLNITKTEKLDLKAQFVENTKRLSIRYRCFQRSNSPITDVQKYQELFEDRFCDFDEDFKTKTRFNIIKTLSKEELTVKITYSLKRKPNIENKKRLISAINWLEKVMKMKGEILYGYFGQKTSIVIKFKPN